MLHAAFARLTLALGTATGVVLLVFGLMHALPGDPVDAILGENASSVDRAQLRERLGLDRSLPAQFGSFATGLLRGDLGRSLVTGDPVSRILLERYPATMQLAAAAIVVALSIALPLGAAAAARPGSIADRVSLSLSISAASLPTFALGPLLILTFAVDLGWLPVAGRTGLRSTVLPAVTLGLGMSAVLMRQLRVALITALHLPSIRAARARGVGQTSLLLRHALRNAATATVTVLGLQIGGLAAGAIVTETIFAWPGIGRLLVQAIGSRDYPVVQACVLAISLTYVAVNLLTDLVQAWLDPRLRAPR